MQRPTYSDRPGLSLLEILVVVVLMGIIAAIIVPRFSTQSGDAKARACSTNKGNIEVQCQLWLRQRGTAPQTNLSDIGSDSGFFPEGLPKCPVDGSNYSISTSTLRVNGHSH